MMNLSHPFRRTIPLPRLFLAVCLAAALSAGGILPAATLAQARGPVQRTVRGKVEDRGGAPVKGAVVYLRDDRTTQVKSEISQDDGSYRFVQLSPSTDYDLWAQSDTVKSKTKSISSFDSKNDFNITLVLDK